MFDVVRQFVRDRFGIGIGHPLAVIGVNQLQECLVGGAEFFRVEFEDMEDFVGPAQRVVDQVEIPVADMGDALRFPQPVFAVPQVFLGPLALGDIARRVVDQRLAVDLHQGGADFDIDDGTVAAAVPGFEYRVAHAHCGDPGQQLLFRPQRVPLRHIHRQQFVGRVTEHAAERIVHLHDIAIEIENVNAVAGGAQQHLVLAAGTLHGRSRLQGICPGGHQEPGKQREQQA